MRGGVEAIPVEILQVMRTYRGMRKGFRETH